MAWTKEDGKALKEARNQKGISQETLAKRAGCSAAYITKLERAIHEPSPRMRADLARGLGLGEPNFLTAVDDELFEESDGRDPYPNRENITHMPLFRNASKEVRDAIMGQRFSDGDRSLAYWVVELERLLLKEEAGDLHSVPKDAEVWVETSNDRRP